MNLITSLVSFLLIGLAAGWIVGKILEGRSFGLVGNLIIGMIGSVVGGVLFWILGIASRNMIGSLVTAVVGALVFLFVASRLGKRPSGSGTPPAKR
ncbi:MAG: GlsB/YeaQ/YmgE family stress response membrane protein [Rhodospirillales bacterium]|nr:GlsB/YeaQ/YmgE family stress response membrane protein [Rhodospirillales bacterium]